LLQGSHGGDIYKAAEVLGVSVAQINDYSSNVSHLQPLCLRQINFAELISVLPEPHSRTLKSAYASRNKLNPNQICVTSGTTEAIEAICRLYSGKSVRIERPCYSDYAHYSNLYGLHETDNAELVFICNPNNPTGKTIKREDIMQRATYNPQTMFIVDESYMPFHLNETDYTLLGNNLNNIAILRSFSKIFCVPGLRLGFLISANLEFIEKIAQSLSLWNVNTPAQAVGIMLLDEDTKASALESARLKHEFLNSISDIKWLEPTNSDVNFVLCRLHGKKSADIFAECFKKHTLIRDCSNFVGLDGEYIRFSVKADMKPLEDIFRSII
jgi:threonine-phosphate decarboxylase